MSARMKEGYLLLAIAGFGAIGAVARYLISNWANQAFGAGFPVGTLVVNVAGCFLIGVLMEWEALSDNFSAELRLALTAGFLGALTTFSTFGHETISQFQKGGWLGAGMNIVANICLGLFAVSIGTSVVQWMLRD